MVAELFRDEMNFYDLSHKQSSDLCRCAVHLDVAGLDAPPRPNTIRRSLLPLRIMASTAHRLATKAVPLTRIGLRASIPVTTRASIPVVSQSRTLHSSALNMASFDKPVATVSVSPGVSKAFTELTS